MKFFELSLECHETAQIHLIFRISCEMIIFEIEEFFLSFGISVIVRQNNSIFLSRYFGPRFEFICSWSKVGFELLFGVEIIFIKKVINYLIKIIDKFGIALTDTRQKKFRYKTDRAFLDWLSSLILYYFIYYFVC